VPAGFRLFATPWWVNVLVLVPIVCWYFWRRTGLGIPRRSLVAVGLFGLAFGFVEAAVVVYLRGALGLTPDPGVPPNQLLLLAAPRRLLVIDVVREGATMVMLVAIAVLAARRARERWAMFLYVFALWDLGYYAGLRTTIGWPPSLLTNDVLFLIPGPWISQVWYPLVVSGLTMLAVLLAPRLRAHASPPPS
jgi:hypothetical protein